MSSANRALIAVNVACYGLSMLLPERTIAILALWPIGRYVSPELGMEVGFEPWQLVTFAFLHGSPLHLLLNMLGLLSFGGEIERSLGARRYLTLYFAAVLAAALVQLVVVSWEPGGPPHATVGASGGVFGVLLAFGVLFPRRMVLLVFPPIPMRAWLLVTLFGLVELASGVLGTQAGIAHFAHLGGMLGGWLALRQWLPRRR
jgi:membrane associated rhomboid family serine protease